MTGSPRPLEPDPVLEASLGRRLAFLYGEPRVPDILEGLRTILRRHGERRGGPVPPPRWGEGDAILIAYGDSVQSPGVSPLASLKAFLDRHLAGTFSMVHLLPFFPFSSDDGFAVSDFRAVNPGLGTWDDVQALRERFELMFDLVLNHMSREHLWFVNYMHDLDPGRDYVIEVDPRENLSMVVRPRSTPLLSRVRTPRGIRHVWATFSNDQIDLNYANPEVLLEFIDTLFFYIRRGARGIRLDAIAYLWKEIGTRCIHLPQTHEVVKIFRSLLEALEPGVFLLTETNVPHRENISYLDAGVEANMVYQFSLPPLILHAIHTGDSRYLTRWAASLAQAPLPPGCTYLNFTASHDGIGLRPLEGIVPDAEVDALVAAMRERGGYVSLRATSEGRDRPYELNISYFDAFRDPAEGDNELLVLRFLLSQTIPLVLQGLPAVYINALTAAPNDYLGVERTAMTRSINRRKWDRGELEYEISRPLSDAGQVFPELVRRLRLRKGLPALHPEADQRIVESVPGVFVVIREESGGGQCLVALHNCTPEPLAVPLEGPLLPLRRGWYDRLNEEPPTVVPEGLVLRPFQAAWLVCSGLPPA